MPFKLIGTTIDQAFELRDDRALVVGRASGSDLAVIDTTVSRRHARIMANTSGLEVTDLGSSNGTFVNGARIESARAGAGDVVTFGSVSFRLVHVTAPMEAATIATDVPTPVPTASPSIVKRRSIAQPTGPLAAVFRASSLREVRQRPAPSEHEAHTEKKLALLLEVAKGLSRAEHIDVLLDTIVSMVFEILDVDRVAIELADDAGSMAQHISRDRRGDPVTQAIPQSIARKVVQERIAVLTDNAPADTRFGGQSIVAQKVRSAMCAPLLGSDDIAQGVLYVDNVTATQRFGDDDLDFLIAFSNIAAVAIENSRLSERVRRQTLVRSNFERFFAPALAARIAATPGTVRLGGEKRTVALLFSDIRDFTALAEAMRPDELARVLSEYYTAMVEIVFRHGGALDKFIGDALLAQWGAPLGAPDDADRAMRAALDMQREMQTLNARWLQEGRQPLRIGIALNVGETFAGYIGSERRLEYTLIGDAVNTASRLCALAEGGEVLLTESVRAALASPPALQPRGTVELRGRVQGVPVYSVMP
jgi:adenylate cyclase